MNIVTKTIITLPEDVCNIIYEYYKLPFVDEIQNPFHKYLLYKYLHHANNKKEKTNSSNFEKKFIHHHDCIRKTIFGEQWVNYTSETETYDYEHLYLQGIYGSHRCDPHLKDRDYLKKICDMNGIQYKKGTQRKTLIKKLMKL